MRRLLAIVGVLAAIAAAPARQTFTGVVTDEMCADGDHSRMRMGATDAECATACADAHGAGWVLYTGSESYTLKNLREPAAVAGRKVTVTGILDEKTKTIDVESIQRTGNDF